MNYWELKYLSKTSGYYGESWAKKHGKADFYQLHLLSINRTLASRVAKGSIEAHQDVEKALLILRDRVNRQLYGAAYVKRGIGLGWLASVEVRSAAHCPVTPHIHLLIAGYSPASYERVEALVSDVWKALDAAATVRHAVERPRDLLKMARYCTKHWQSVAVSSIN